MSKKLLNQGTIAPNRPWLTDATPPQEKKARMDEVLFKEALTSVKIAVVAVGYPEIKMSSDSIFEAHDKIPTEETQVRFAKCSYKPGYLVVVCADSARLDLI